MNKELGVGWRREERGGGAEGGVGRDCNSAFYSALIYGVPIIAVYVCSAGIDTF